MVVDSVAATAAAVGVVVLGGAAANASDNAGLVGWLLMLMLGDKSVQFKPLINVVQYINDKVFDNI